MMVSMEDIHDAFATFTVDLVDAFQAIPHDDKTLIVVATEVVDYNSNEAEIRMVSTMGYNPSSTVFHFDSTDWWYWGVDGDGKCGPFLGEGIGSDAAKELTKKANFSLAVPIGRIYYTDEILVSVYPMEYAIPWQNHPYGRFSLIFWQVEIPSQPPPEWSCLCPDEMNYYLCNIKNIIAPDNLPDPNMTLCLYHVDALLAPGGYSIDWQHRVDLTYGIQHVSVVYPEPPFYTD